jgi:phenylpropionate dioxygenase-like ring-hydroxylating dioxygenase large terminal subunit
MDPKPPVTEAFTEQSFTGFELPVLGFRNYWYPVMLSEKLKKRPMAQSLLGEELVLFRSNGELGALANRCPHRGTPLSLGKSHFPGTISCAYHGWTFDRSGQCVGALLEGPDATIPRKARVRSYPVQERAGLVWVYMGEEAPPPVEEDVPALLLTQGPARIIKMEDWTCNWRPIAENFMEPTHALYLHRDAPISCRYKMPAWAGLSVKRTDDGKGFRLEYINGPFEAEYPGLGKYPRPPWWRRLLARQDYPFFYAEVRLPGFTTVKIPPREGLFFIQVWAPIDEAHTRNFYITMTNDTGWRALLFRAFYHLVASWANDRLLLGEDKWILEALRYGQERFSALDTGVMQWRLFASQHARGVARSAQQP